MARLLLERIDAIAGDVVSLDAGIGEAMEPFLCAHDLLLTIPCFSSKVAVVFIFETGGDMGVFPSAGHLARNARICRSIEIEHDPAGERRPQGRSASQQCHPRALRAPSSRRSTAASRPDGAPHANWSRSNTQLLVAAWNMLTNGDVYRDPGADYFANRTPAETKDRRSDSYRNSGITSPLPD